MDTPIKVPLPRTLLPKPSDALTAMIEGLRESRETTNCVVDMSTFGDVNESGICFGCAATYTTLKAIKTVMDGVPFDQYQRGKVTGQSWIQFEYMIDVFRYGHDDYKKLLRYYELSEKVISELKPRQTLQHLTSDRWCDHLPAYEAYRDQLVAAGY